MLGLGEELDLADAAAPELDVVARDGDAAEAAEGVDLPLHRVHVGDGGEVEILAPDERRQILEQHLAGLDVAGPRARLDHRCALPVLAERLVVVERGIARHGGLRGASVGPQAVSGAEPVSVRGALVQQPHYVSRQPPEEWLRLDARLEARAPQC